jgi:hypothetical protein
VEKFYCAYEASQILAILHIMTQISSMKICCSGTTKLGHSFQQTHGANEMEEFVGLIRLNGPGGHIHDVDEFGKGHCC